MTAGLHPAEARILWWAPDTGRGDNKILSVSAGMEVLGSVHGLSRDFYAQCYEKKKNRGHGALSCLNPTPAPVPTLLSWDLIWALHSNMNSITLSLRRFNDKF